MPTRNGTADAGLTRMVDRRHAPGMSHVVVTANEVVYEGHAGVLDATGDARVEPTTMYMACSTTKVLTAIAILQLAERGGLELHVPVSRYIDHPFGEGVTAAGLLAHTSGVPNPMPLDWFFVEGERMEHDAVYASALATSGKPADPPGRRYRYSNLGYWLLGHIIERVTELRYAEAIAHQIFEPLGLDREAVSFDLPPASRLATGHSPKWSATTAAFYLLTPKRYWGAAGGGWSRFSRLVHHGAAYGGLYTTVEALGAVVRNLLSDAPTLLSADTRNRMFAEQRISDGKPIGGSLGWVIGRTPGFEYVGKQGGAIGFHGNVRLYPEAGLGSVFFANSTRVTPGPIDRVSDALDRPFLTQEWR